MELLIIIIQSIVFSMLFGGIGCATWMLIMYAKFLKDEKNYKKDLTNF